MSSQEMLEAVNTLKLRAFFSQTKVFEKPATTSRAPREINTLPFSKMVLETIFSIRTIATSLEKEQPSHVDRLRSRFDAGPKPRLAA
jgi:hypothetical protein